MSDATPERWTELKLGPTGISCTVYEEHHDGHVVVVDETWFTWDEAEEHRSNGTTVALGLNDDLGPA